MTDVDTEIAPYCKPAKQPGEDNSIYLTRILVSYGSYLYAYYKRQQVKSEYLEKFSFMQTMMAVQPHQVRSLYITLASYIKTECKHITSYDICKQFVELATLSSLINDADKEKVQAEHIKKFADIFWVFVKTINL